MQNIIADTELVDRLPKMKNNQFVTEDYLTCMMGDTPHQSQRNIFPLALRVE